ncbi:hypothetical protein B484DRAFT_453756 [Ochromonadaceae sp. CCMP2298]|nr:hypothetical protein B484DRAFT_453756 [Ochromonadaceae sp. CCMP2298]
MLRMLPSSSSRFIRAGCKPTPGTAGSRKLSTSSFWQWTTAQRPTWKESKKEAAVAFVVFGVTGSLTMWLVRPCLSSVLGLEGSLWEGPNSYRVASVLCISPIYSVLLLTIGTVAGRHNFFAKMGTKILGRFVPKSAINKVLCGPAKGK